jgi:hypothetical protein
MSLPSHLRFLEQYADADPGDLADFYPQTAEDEIQPGPREDVFWADGIGYLGDKDGTMVPVDAEHLEPMPENIFDAEKFSTLVAAIRQGRHPVVLPGYSNLSLEDGELDAQVRDGNHRTFAAIVAGSPFSWVAMSAQTVQDLNEERTPYMNKLYAAIRKTQAAHDAPLFKRKQLPRVKRGADLSELRETERRYDESREALREYYVAMLDRFGSLVGASWSASDQRKRPQLFWKLRIRELYEERGADWVWEKIHDTDVARRAQAVQEDITALGSKLYEMRQAAGLDPRAERLDPSTGKPVKLAR